MRAGVRALQSLTTTRHSVLAPIQLTDELVKGRDLGIKLTSALPSARMLNCTLIAKSESLKQEWKEALKAAQSTFVWEYGNGERQGNTMCAGWGWMCD